MFFRRSLSDYFETKQQYWITHGTIKSDSQFKSTPPLFTSFLNLSNGRIDKAKILTADRAREISRPVSKDICFNKASLGFIQTSWVIIGSTLVTLWPPANLIRLSWKFFCDSSNHITEVIFSVLIVDLSMWTHNVSQCFGALTVIVGSRFLLDYPRKTQLERDSRKRWKSPL